VAEIHALWSEPAETLSPARQRLRDAVAALDRAQCEAEDSTKPLRRLDQVTAEVAELEHEIARLQSEDSATLGRWIAEGSIGPRPGPSASTVATEQRLTELQPAVRAVASALPAAQEAHRQSPAHLHGAAAERSLAIADVAVEASAVVAGELTAALNVALAAEAKLLGLCNELRARPDNGNGSAAEKIAALIKRAKAAAGVPRDPESGRALLGALAHNPSAEL
jgi:hypothetical protein